jgi:hypothetical protein
MSWVALLQGEVRLGGAVEHWRGLEADLRPGELPDMLAVAIGEEDERISVQDALEACDEHQDALGEGPFFLDVAIEGDRLLVEALIVEDDYRDFGRHVLALVTAAAQAGGTGRLQVRDADAFEGGAMTLRDGQIAFETFTTDGDEMSDADRRGFDAVIARARPSAPIGRAAKKPVAKKPSRKAAAKKPVAKNPSRKPAAKKPAKKGRRS